MSNRRKIRPARERLAPGLYLLPPIGELLDGGQGVPLCDCGREMQYLGDVVDVDQVLDDAGGWR